MPDASFLMALICVLMWAYLVFFDDDDPSAA
jgi:hypothetical protein